MWFRFIVMVCMMDYRCTSSARATAKEIVNQTVICRQIEQDPKMTGAVVLQKTTDSTSPLMPGAVTQRVVYRVMADTNRQSTKYWYENFAKLERLQDDFLRLNGTSAFVMRMTNENIFHSLFVLYTPMLEAAQKSGLNFSAIDCCHSKHPNYDGKSDPMSVCACACAFACACGVRV